MKVKLIAAVVGAIIVFMYQSLSWVVLPIHDNTLKYTPAEQNIADVLSEHLSEVGVYSIPGTPPGSSDEEQQAIHENMMGKPFAMIQYHPAYENDMGMSMLKGFLINLVSVWLLVWVMLAAPASFNSFSKRFQLSILFAVFVLFQGPLMLMNWWSTPWHYLSGDVIDTLLGWALCGIWLGWYLGRKTA